MKVPAVAIGKDAAIPQVGFGTFQISPEATVEAVAAALQAGYRHIDTAQGYRNEREVIAAIDQLGIDPASVFVTSKLGNAHLSYQQAHDAIDDTVRELGDKRADLFLLHWPLPTVRDFMIVWRAIEDAFTDGKVLAVGVSNFQIPHLERLMSQASVQPVVNQIELHPYLTQGPLRTFHEQNGIVTEAWSPIGQGVVLADPTIARIAAQVGVSAAQVVLRWHLQRDTVIIPRSQNAMRVRENIDLFGFELSDNAMREITSLNRNQRTGGDPDTFRYKF